MIYVSNEPREISDMKSGKNTFLLLAIGIFSRTQIYIGGAIGISELIVFLIAPYLFMKNYAILRREGFLTLLLLVLLSLAGCIISCQINTTPFKDAIRGVMANYGLFAAIVVFHSLLRKNVLGIKWFLLGVAISLVISTFVFQSGSELYMYGEGRAGAAAAEGIINSPLFWTARIGSFWILPCSGWYMSTPQFWNWFSMGAWGVVAILISQGSGRSAALTMLASAILIFLCGKSKSKIYRVSRQTGRLLLIGLVFLYLFNTFYKITASNGLLGEKAQEKYEKQVRGAKSPLAVLMSGRSEFFVGVYACLRKPIFGYGPWPWDKEHLYEDWLNKYGTEEATEEYYKYLYDSIKRGWGERLHMIPSHSVIIQFWLWYGIAGLVLWIYVLYKFWRYLRYDMYAVPQYIGYIVGWLPMYVWNIFFSPFGGRLEYGAFLSAILLCAAVNKGIVRLPNEMLAEIDWHNRKG